MSFHNKSFINVDNFESFDECARYIYYLSLNKTQLHEIQTAPVFPNNEIPSLLNLSKNETWIKQISFYLRKNYYNF